MQYIENVAAVQPVVPPVLSMKSASLHDVLDTCRLQTIG